MAHPLPVISVASLADVERVPIHAGPCRVILVRAESLSEARAMLSVLRAKGVLQTPHAGAEGFDEFAVQAAELEEGSDSDGGGAGSDLGERAWGGWVAEQQEGLDLRLFLSDADSDHDGGANGAHQDHVAGGWVVENLPRFRSAIDLGLLLEEVTSEIVPLLVSDPADAVALRRLRTQAREIRRVGKQLPGLMGQAPVTLANFVNNTAAEGLRRGIGGAAWMASRLDKVLSRVLALYEQEPVVFADPDA